MIYLSFLMAAGLIGLDQLFKWLALVNIKGESVSLIKFGTTEVLNLTYHENRGAAFSMMEGKTWFLVGFTSIVLIVLVLLILFKKIKTPFVVWTVMLIVAGGVGNLIDRIFRGYVIDYIDFRLIGFAIFNFADCCVVIGTILLLVYLVFFEGRKKQEEKTPELEAEHTAHE